MLAVSRDLLSTESSVVKLSWKWRENMTVVTYENLGRGACFNIHDK